MKASARRQSHRHAVLLTLAKSPSSGADLRDTLAARCGSKELVSKALEHLKHLGLIRPEERPRRIFVWHLTQAGITEAMRLVAERGQVSP